MTVGHPAVKKHALITPFSPYTILIYWLIELNLDNDLIPWLEYIRPKFACCKHAILVFIDNFLKIYWLIELNLNDDLI